MDANRFDSIARKLASRRVSRRTALKQTGTGLAAAGLVTAGVAAVGPGRAAARQATPEPAPATETPVDTSTLFVQAFQAGSITPTEGTEGHFTVSLEGGLGQTIYFSDRPNRVVGAWPTAAFLGTLGFFPDNPPNAAILMERDGETDFAVVELFNPVYDEQAANLTYEVKVLEAWEQTTEIQFGDAPADLAQLAPSFGATHLLIDGLWDCEDATMSCMHNGNVVGTIANEEHDGYCAHEFACMPCTNQDPSYWAGVCNERFSDCNGECNVWNFCSRDAPLGHTYCKDSDSRSHFGD